MKLYSNIYHVLGMHSVQFAFRIHNVCHELVKMRRLLVSKCCGCFWFFFVVFLNKCDKGAFGGGIIISCCTILSLFVFIREI